MQANLTAHLTFGVTAVATIVYVVLLIWLWRRPYGRRKGTAALLMGAVIFSTYAALVAGPGFVCGNDPICLKEGLAGPLYLVLVAPIQSILALVLSHFRPAKRSVRWG
jgi:hypothetical protein